MFIVRISRHHQLLVETVDTQRTINQSFNELSCRLGKAGQFSKTLIYNTLSDDMLNNPKTFEINLVGFSEI